MDDWRPDIFDFLDYRAFLKAWYEAGKANTRAMSYRWIARRAGFSSPSFIRDVILGEKNLGPDSVESLLPVLALDDAGERYFRALVDFDQAETSDSRNDAFEVVASARRFRRARRIDEGVFEYLSHWYYPAIREMAARPDFRDDASWIARQLVPRIETAQAQRALDTLFDLGMFVRSDDGEIERAETSLATEHEAVRSLAIINYHRQMLERAAESMDHVRARHRDLGAMTVCIAADTIPELKQRVHDFREIMLELCDSDPHPQVVYQFNTQLFPLTDPESLPPPDAADDAKPSGGASGSESTSEETS